MSFSIRTPRALFQSRISYRITHPKHPRCLHDNLAPRRQPASPNSLPKSSPASPIGSSSPPTSTSTSTSASSSRLQRIISRLPPSLKRYARTLEHAPVRHVVAFLALHEITAVVPLVGLSAAFHWLGMGVLGEVSCRFAGGLVVWWCGLAGRWRAVNMANHGRRCGIIHIRRKALRGSSGISETKAGLGSSGSQTGKIRCLLLLIAVRAFCSRWRRRTASRSCCWHRGLLLVSGLLRGLPGVSLDLLQRSFERRRDSPC